MKQPTIAPERTGLNRKLTRIWWSAKKWVIRNREQVIPFDVDLKLAVRPIDRLGRRVLLDGYSDRELAVLLDLILKPGMCYFDVGAHFGQYTLMAAKRVGAKGAVHAFEPTAHTFQQLRRNVELNRFTTVNLNNCALYSKETELEFHVCNSEGMSEFNSIGETLRPEIAQTEVVQATTLDAYCAKNEVASIDLMKIDVEGAELDVLRGGEKTLESPGAPPLSVEFNEATCESVGSSTRELRDKLLSLGYQLYRLDYTTFTLHAEEDRERYDEVANIFAVKRVKEFEDQLQNA